MLAHVSYCKRYRVVMIEGHLTAQQAADHLGIAKQTLYNLAGSPDFPDPIHVGRTPLWPVEGLDAWRAKHPARRQRQRDSPAP